MGTGTVTRKPGKNLAAILSRSLAKDRHTAVLELVINGYDADAENVWVDYNAEEEQLVVEDDGEGMSREGIEDFYRMGDSEKKVEPFTPSGRKRIGKFGVATLLLEYLAGSYLLETWRDGERITVHEDFEETRKGVEPTSSVTKIPRKEHGTRISMSDLRFKKSDLDLERLTAVLEWEAPCLSDFKVYVNKIRIPQRSIVTFCTEYAVNKEVEGVGEVKGSIFYTISGDLKSPGIFIYVNGRAVGDSQLFNGIFDFKKGNVLGLVNADGLEKFISFDRSRFQTDSPEYQAVRSAIASVIYAMNEDPRREISNRVYNVITRKSGGRGMQVSLKETLKTAEEVVNQNLGGEKIYRLEYAIGDGSWLSRCQNGVIQINGANPQLALASTRRNPQVKDQLLPTLLMLSLSAIAESRVGEDGREVFASLARNVHRVAREIYGGFQTLENPLRLMTDFEQAAIPVAEMQFCPYRLYPIQELALVSGLDVNTVKFLFISGALEEYEDGQERKFQKFIGGEAREFFRKIEGYVPCMKIMKPKEYSRDIHTASAYGINFNSLDPAEFGLAFLADSVDYLMNVGREETPFVMVRQDKIDDFRRDYLR